MHYSFLLNSVHNWSLGTPYNSTLKARELTMKTLLLHTSLTVHDFDKAMNGFCFQIKIPKEEFTCHGECDGDTPPVLVGDGICVAPTSRKVDHIEEFKPHEDCTEELPPSTKFKDRTFLIRKSERQLLRQFVLEEITTAEITEEATTMETPEETTMADIAFETTEAGEVVETEGSSDDTTEGSTDDATEGSAEDTFYADALQAQLAVGDPEVQLDIQKLMLNHMAGSTVYPVDFELKDVMPTATKPSVDPYYAEALQAQLAAGSDEEKLKIMKEMVNHMAGYIVFPVDEDLEVTTESIEDDTTNVVITDDMADLEINADIDEENLEND